MLSANQKFFRKYKSVLAIFVALIILDGAIWYLILFPKNSGNLELYFLDVGQGDSQLVNLPSDIQILIDGGAPNGEVLSELAKVLPANDYYIDLVVMTHPQLDHFGGLVDVLKKYQVGAFLSTSRKARLTLMAILWKSLKRAGFLILFLALETLSGMKVQVFRSYHPTLKIF